MNDHSVKLQATVKDHTFQFEESAVHQQDITRSGPAAYHLIKDHLSVTGVIETVSANGKVITVKIEGEYFSVVIKDEMDQMLDKMGFGIAAGKQVKEIKAPMPGLVLEINVQQGEELKQGSKLLILEAMKMENSITIPVDAIIKKINVEKGQAVEKGQVLVELE